ncbi:MAG: amidophosphoribosyltransferase [Pseudomonadota bacterium]
MCGIIGIVAQDGVNQLLYDGLTVLQHRGQDAAGIVTCDNRRFYLRKNNGLVRDVFQTRHMLNLRGNMGIGHVRYPTAGNASSAEAQPFYVNSPFGISFAHNGNLTNAETLKRELFREGLRHINTDSDSELLLNVFAQELQSLNKFKIDESDIFQAVSHVHKRCRGGYSAIAMIMGYGIVAFRDPHGIRPLVFGKRDTAEGTEYIVASESVAIDSLDFEVIRDVAAGEAIFIDFNGNLHVKQCAEQTKRSPCIFEYVYLARPDSIIDEISVHKARLRMGTMLAKKILRLWPEHDIDVVMPIPDTSRTSAIPLAHDLGVKYREGFVKNRYIPRTFIMPGQNMRKKSVRQKFNVIDLEFEDKNVLLVDDSIVRGTTAKQLVKMARNAGARKVYLASAAPPVRYPNVYGIDMPSSRELLAYERDDEGIARQLGADWLIYQDIEDLIASTRGSKEYMQFDTSCFDGKYTTGDIEQTYLVELDRLRNDDAKQESANTSAEVIELYNSF